MKLPVPFLQIPLAFDAATLAAEVAALGEQPWRPHPQGYPGNSALTLITTHGDPTSDSLGGAMRATPYLERCPYLMQVIESFGTTLGRTRLMRLSGQAEVSKHVDIAYYWREHMRVHVPIMTQPTVRFHCGDQEIHMASGDCWIFDTWRMHKVLNDADAARIHLVADTVGGDRFWQLLGAGRPAGQEIPGWQPYFLAPRAAAPPRLDLEALNVPVVMTPWEMREHFGFLLSEANEHPEIRNVHRASMELTRRWHALWACFGESPKGFPRYRALLRDFEQYLARAPTLHLQNGVVLGTAIRHIVLKNALADGGTAAIGAELREPQKTAQVGAIS